jgi:hypothetical protein
VPGTFISPFGSWPPRRIECAILDRSNPSTSSAWHLLHASPSLAGTAEAALTG